MTNATLTDRYLFAATRSVPEPQREELRREIAERIADATDARLQAGDDREAAEHAVLVELGDPDALAAAYSDRPLQLIGPAHYLLWRRLLKLLLAIVLPAAAFGYALAQMIDGASFGDIIGGLVVVLIMVTVHLAFWTTLVFAIIDRLSGGRSVLEWTPDQLPALTEPPRNQMLVDYVANVVMVVIAAALILVGPRLVPSPDGGESVPFLEPATWAWLSWYLLALLAVHLLFWTVLFRHGRWSYGFVLVSLLLATATAVPVAWTLATGTLFNPAYLARTGWTDAVEQLGSGGAVASVLALLVLASAAVWPLDGFVKARRARRDAAVV
ncbi:hypothetical protein EXU48_20065 [Occultella glacieicola]|uniref:Uncharacterized protein n=1 Tax=Occultella glacieicola TaxID=2518684 RepID=A0ABY2DZF6_9MICO|nr:permease prefix domain 1-containing protein [Occultella glacieicola]TDE89468.1 hypothetical protein EXU48_20065 [Occultella glacieicola]